MEVAEQIALLHEGRIEQVGSPRDLYERPANEFVMGFVGPVNRLGRRLSGRATSPSAPSPARVTRRWWSASCISASRCASSSSATTASTCGRS